MWLQRSTHRDDLGFFGKKCVYLYNSSPIGNAALPNRPGSRTRPGSDLAPATGVYVPHARRRAAENPGKVFEKLHLTPQTTACRQMTANMENLLPKVNKNNEIPTIYDIFLTKRPDVKLCKKPGLSAIDSLHAPFSSRIYKRFVTLAAWRQRLATRPTMDPGKGSCNAMD